MQRQIDDIMDNFPFVKVLDVMRRLNWQWRRRDTHEPYYPDESELRACARSLLAEVKENSFAGTGGLMASNFGGRLRLAFEAQEWTVEE